MKSRIRKKYRKILVIRFSSIGDIILCSPIFRCLKQQSDAEIHWLTKKEFAFVNEYNPYIDKIISFDGDYKSCKTLLKNEKYDLIVDLHKNIRSKRFISGLCIPSIHFKKLNAEKWILVNIHKDVIREPRHLVDRYFDALRKIDIVNDGEGLDYFYGDEARNPVREKPYIAYGIGGTYFTKKMPAENIIQHFGHLKLPLVLLGGKSETEESVLIKNALGHRCINLVNQCDLHTTALVIKEASWVISHDTATMHLAAAFKKKILSIWGATSPLFGMAPYLPRDLTKNSVILEKENLPCHPCSKLGGNACPKGHFKCMKDLDEKRVRQKINFIQNL